MTGPRPDPYCAIHDAAHPPCDPGPVISSNAPDDADRVAALLEERPGPTEAMRALFADRRPVAGWVRVDDADTLTGEEACGIALGVLRRVVPRRDEPTERPRARKE